MKNWVRLISLALVMVAIAGNSAVGQVLFGSDYASNYGGSWTNSSNGGTKFGAWDMWVAGTGGFKGHYLGSSTSQGFGDINSSSTAFGMYAHSAVNVQSYAQRFFSGTGSPESSGRAYLLPGMSFRIDLAVAYRNGDKGIRLKNQDYGDLFLFNITADNYRANGVDLGWSYSQSSIFELTVEQINSTQYRVKIVRGAEEYNSGNLTGVVSGFLLYVNTTESADLNNLRFNNLEVYTGSHIELSTSIAASAGWRMLSSPVNTTFSDILAEGWTQGASAGGDVTNGTPNVRTYNGTSFVNVTDLTTSPSIGQGFVYYHFNDDDFNGGANSGATTFSVSGSENAAPVSPTLNSTNKGAGEDNVNGWSLIGNPFASTIDWDLLTKSNVEGSVYTYSSGSFISWNGTTGSITNGLLAPFQGFFVQTSQTGSPSITIESADKTSGGTFYGKVAEVTGVELAVSGEGLRNGAFLQFSEGANVGYDSKDAWKLLPLDLTYALLGTRLDAEHLLDINNLPMLTERFELPMSFQATKSGRFTLTAPNVNLPADWSITLVDNESGSRMVLSSALSYSFDYTKASKASASEPTRPVGVKAAGDTRFTLIIEPNKATSNEGRVTPNAIALEQNYPNPFNPSTGISFAIPAQLEIKLSVFDINGREVEVLASGVKSAGKHTANWNAAGRASGVYMLRLQAGDQVLTRKMTLLK